MFCVAKLALAVKASPSTSLRTSFDAPVGLRQSRTWSMLVDDGDTPSKAITYAVEGMDGAFQPRILADFFPKPAY